MVDRCFGEQAYGQPTTTLSAHDLFNTNTALTLHLNRAEGIAKPARYPLARYREISPPAYREAAQEIKEIEWSLNNRPRKKLGYHTPHEVFYLNLQLGCSSYFVLLQRIK